MFFFIDIFGRIYAIRNDINFVFSFFPTINACKKYETEKQLQCTHFKLLEKKKKKKVNKNNNKTLRNEEKSGVNTHTIFFETVFAVLGLIIIITNR